MSDLPVIFTEITKETDPIGGIWSAQPFAMTHVEWIAADDHEKIVTQLRKDCEAYAETIREIRIAAARGHLDEVDAIDADKARLDWLCADKSLSLAHVGGWDEDDPMLWAVHRESGNRNDREWTLLGSGLSVRDAIDAARSATPAA